MSTALSNTLTEGVHSIIIRCIQLFTSIIYMYFNRSKGHGFIISDQREGEEIFVHISE